ncbi:MAG: hypothetical protein ACI97N_002251 [Cognaticolwellia sp.]|jgi:hypothetical protein
MLVNSQIVLDNPQIVLDKKLYINDLHKQKKKYAGENYSSKIY